MDSHRTTWIPDRGVVRSAVRAYRSSFARSLEAAHRHDQLTQRLHAIDSAHALMRLVFALEGRPSPEVNDLSDALPDVEEAQDWPAGYLRWALLNLVWDPAPKHQLELARRVERLLAIRGLGEPPDDRAPTSESAAGWQHTAVVVRRAP